MENVVERKWTTPDGALLFTFECNPASATGLVISVRICMLEQPTASDAFVVQRGCSTQFNIRFPQGSYAYGELSLDFHADADGLAVACVFVRMQYGSDDGTSAQSVEALMVTFTTQELLDAMIPEVVLIETSGEVEVEDEEDMAVALEATVEVDKIVTPEGEIVVVAGVCPEAGANAPTDALWGLPAAQGVQGVGSVLFPYVYVRKWPTVSEQQLRRRFVQYTLLKASPPQDSLYGSLAGATSGQEMKELALDFIEGAPPYQDQFVSAADLPKDNFSVLHKVACASADPQSCPETLMTQCQVLLPQGFLTSSAYAADLDRVWQSYFALVILPSYDPALLAQLARLLVTAHLLNYLFVANAGKLVLTPALLRELVEATVVLPGAVFPLPPAAASPPESDSPPGGGSGWIEPYAIGDLQMVRHRLLRYAPGEIAYIENVMRGERKEISRRRVRRQVDAGTSETDDLENLDNQAVDGRNDLLAETVKTIAERSSNKSYTNLTTSYGPPTLATTNGGPVTKTVQQGPNSEDVTRFAHDVLNKTVSRISRSVSTVRSSSTLNETEEAVKSTIDNTTGQRNRMGVFRWLNKVYEAEVINYGKRLMIEFMLINPAARFVSEGNELDGPGCLLPLPPKSQGINSFEAVSRENYASLAAEYNAAEITPPPPEMTYVSATLGSGEAKLIAIPAGYRARFATVNAIVAPTAMAPQVLIGSKICQSPYGNVAMPSGCGATLAVSVSGYAASSTSPPSGPPPAPFPATTDILVNVAITCVPSDTLMAEWRIKTYNAILTGYRKMCLEYGHFGNVLRIDHSPARSPQAARDIENREIRRACLRLIQERCVALAGNRLLVAANRQQPVQVIQAMFEWHEMTYHFYRCDGAAGSGLPLEEIGNEQMPLTGFLKAGLARVMVPARPEYVTALLYLLSSGLVWEGGGQFVPAETADVPVINELKATAVRGVPCGYRVGKPWEVVVPTAMQVIDGAGEDCF